MNKRYKAFISYSHQNEKFAQWLHHALECYKIPNDLKNEHPNLPNSLYPIFRDREELPTSFNLGNHILQALKNSEYLIVICSIETAKSFWVNQEIIKFKQLHGEEKVLAIILNGEPNALSKESFSDELECFPKALRYKVVDGQLSSIETEPIAADVRKGKDGYKFGKLKLIAGLLEIGLEELYQRESKREKKRRWILLLMISSVLLTVSFLAINLFFEKNRAKKETLKVENLLFKAEIEKGFIYKNQFNRPLKAQHIFAHALQMQNSQHQKNIALILYKGLEQSVNLIKSYDNNRSFYKSLIDEAHKKSLPLTEQGEEKIVCCDRWNTKFFLKNKKTNKTLFEFEKPNVYYDNNRRLLDQQVSSVFFLKNTEEIVSWDYASNINFWDKEKSLPIEVLHHGGKINGVLFSKDETELLSWGNNTKVKLWKRGEVKPIWEAKHDALVRGATFSHNEEKILSWSNDGEIKLSKRWFIFLIDSYVIFKHSSSVNGAIFSKDDQEVLSWSDDGTAKLWSIHSKQAIAILKHKSRVIGAKFINNEKGIISWSVDGEVKVWHVKKRESPVRFEYKGTYAKKKYWHGTFDLDRESCFYWNSHGAIRLYSLDGKKCFFNMKQEEFLDGASLSKSQTKILSWDSPVDKRTLNSRIITDIGQIKVWSVNQNTPLVILEHDKPIVGTIFNKNETKILSWSKDRTIKLWSINSSNPLLVLRSPEEIFYAQFYNNEKEILSCSKKGEVRLWNIKDGSFKVLLNSFLIDKNIFGVKFTPNLENTIFWTLDKKLYLWYKKDNKPFPILSFKDWVNGAIFSKNNENILAWSSDGTVKLWNIKRHKMILHLKHGKNPIWSAIFSENEKMILSWSYDGITKLWSKEYNKPLITLNTESICEVKFSKDEKSIIILTASGKLLQYEIYPKEKKLDKFLSDLEKESGTYLDEVGELKILGSTSK